MASISLPGLINPHDLSADRQFAMNLARGLEVLRAFTAMDPLLGNRELHDRTGLPKPTISRLTYTLTLLGYLNYDEKLQKYRLGSGVLSLGYPLLVNLRIRQVSRLYIEQLARDTGASVNLGIRDRTSVVYIDTCRVDHGNIYQPDIGSTRPLLPSAIGRALILACTAEERTAILNVLKVEDPQRYAQDWPAWERDQKRFLEQRFCYSAGDWKKEIQAVAAPIRLPSHEIQVAINCTMSAHGANADTMTKTIAPRLLDVVRKIENAYGVN